MKPILNDANWRQKLKILGVLSVTLIQDAIFKDFIKFGVQLVEGYEVRKTEASDPEEKELVENDLAGDSIIKEKVMDKDKVEVIIDENLNLSQV